MFLYKLKAKAHYSFGYPSVLEKYLIRKSIVHQRPFWHHQRLPGHDRPQQLPNIQPQSTSGLVNLNALITDQASRKHRENYQETGTKLSVSIFTLTLLVSLNALGYSNGLNWPPCSHLYQNQRNIHKMLAQNRKSVHSNLPYPLRICQWEKVF